MLRGFPQEGLLRLPRISGELTRGRNRLRAFRGRFRHRLRVKLILADQRRINPRQLMVSGLLPNVVSNPAHDGVDGNPGIQQMREKRLREGTVRTSWPVEGRTLWVAGECDQRAARQIAVDRGQSTLDHERSRLLP